MAARPATLPRHRARPQPLAESPAPPYLVNFIDGQGRADLLGPGWSSFQRAHQALGVMLCDALVDQVIERLS